MADSTPPLSIRIADTLETIATRIREMTVDRAAKGVTSTSIGIIAVVAGFMAVFWLLVGIFRLLGTLMGTETAYAVVGLVLILVGAILWSRRYPQDKTQDTTSQQE
ncbi:MAG: phage holin family protein [Actinomycetia bacterium]|nr:phage holin family protein [Actinomycetes bacterium]